MKFAPDPDHDGVTYLPSGTYYVTLPDGTPADPYTLTWHQLRELVVRVARTPK